MEWKIEHLIAGLLVIICLINIIGGVWIWSSLEMLRWEVEEQNDKSNVIMILLEIILDRIDDLLTP